MNERHLDEIIEKYKMYLIDDVDSFQKEHDKLLEKVEEFSKLHGEEYALGLFIPYELNGDVIRLLLSAMIIRKNMKD